ncbi:hypothetical protein [Microbacterium sp. SS28]|nr:hypothetical protein [Microbacterium sp. SS28]
MALHEGRDRAVAGTPLKREGFGDYARLFRLAMSSMNRSLRAPTLS